MADADFSAPPHPRANPGYGKQAVLGQRPPTNGDFTHLIPRDGAIAAYIDRLPNGADISVKTLAKTTPYGQCALRTSLNRLVAAGHLRRGRECVARPDGSRWITRTWWSRAPRDGDWWEAYLNGDAPDEERPPKPTRSRAYVLLAALARTAPALTLSAAECAALAPLADEWFARGAGEAQLTRALTAGLPSPVHHPAAIVRIRLTDKLPPEPPPARPVLRILECAVCGAPGRSDVLRDGRCGPCRGERRDAPEPRRADPELVRATRAALLRTPDQGSPRTPWHPQRA